MHIGDTTVGDPCFRAVEHPFVVRFVVDRSCAKVRHVTAGVWLAHTERSELHVICIAVTLRYPLHRLLRRAVTCDACCGEATSHDRHAKASITPEQFFNRNWQSKTGAVLPSVHQELPAVEPNLCRLLHYRIRELFAFVPFGGSWTHDVFGESVRPVFNLLLVIVEGHRKFTHTHKLPMGNSLCTAMVTMNVLPSSRPNYTTFGCALEGPHPTLRSLHRPTANNDQRRTVVPSRVVSTCQPAACKSARIASAVS